MKKKIYFSMLFSLFISLVFSQTTHKKFFKPLGKDQTWTVPAGVTQIKVKLWGAGGAGGNYVFNDIGGGGGFATATLTVTPGEKLLIIVGAAGLPGAGSGAYGGGGGKANGVGGRGGGRSSIINAAGAELITAGAGGGGGGVAQLYQSGGHGGGGLEGEPDNWLPYGGGAGTRTGPGSGGVSQANGNCPCGSNPGVGHIGGYAGRYDNGYHGSGGGGYYGGGSGTDLGDGAGGGGSSFIPEGGKTIAATSDIPGNTSDPDYRYPIGYGGAKAKPGNCGVVVIIYTDKSSIADVIDKQEYANKSSVFPNPAVNNITVTYTAQINGKHAFEIADISGKVLLHKEVNAIKGTNRITLDVSQLVKGIYFINIINADKTREKIQLSKE